MTENGTLTTDLNTASIEALTQLPGVGLTMAERIVAARPFASIEEIRRVSGVGPAFLQRLLPLVTASAPPETAEDEAEAVSLEVKPPEDKDEPEADAIPLEAEPQPEDKKDEPLPAEQPPLEEQDAKTEARPEEKTLPERQPITEEKPALVTRSQALWMTLSAGFLSLVLAVALSLSVITAINGGLQFAVPSQVAEISHQMDGLNSQVNALEQDLDGLRSRLDNLEKLSGRLGAVEETSVQLQAGMEEMGARLDAHGVQVDDLAQQVDEVSQEMGGLVDQVETLQGLSTRFQGFLDGLRSLMGELFESEETE